MGTSSFVWIVLEEPNLIHEERSGCLRLEHELADIPHPLF